MVDMNYYLVELKNSYILVPLALLIALASVYLNRLICASCDEDDDYNGDYIKVGLLVVLLVTTVVYIGNLTVSKTESIIQGNPPF